MGISNPDFGRSERPGPEEIWRTWLISGARAHPIDRRRLQGQHRRLKQVLAEGGEPEVLNRPWRGFSRAMVRQSVNEVMGVLTARERVIVTMAYFAGFSNEEIADELGMTARGVQRSLKAAIDRLSSAMERGRRVALALVAAVAGGRIGQWLRDMISSADTQVLAAAVVASVVIVAPAAAPARAAEAPRHQMTHSIGAPSTVARPGATSAPAHASKTSTSSPAAPAVRPNASVANPPSVAIPKLPKVSVPTLKVPPVLKKVL